jgi:hypothetical protein
MSEATEKEAADKAASENREPTEEEIWQQLRDEEAAGEASKREEDDKAAPLNALDAANATFDLTSEEAEQPDADGEDGKVQKASEPKAEPKGDADKAKTDAAGEGDEGKPTEDLAEQVKRLQAELETRPTQSSYDGMKARYTALQKKHEEWKKNGGGRSDTATVQERETALAKLQDEYGDVMAPVIAELQELRQRQEALTADEESRMREAAQEIREHISAERSEFLKEHPDGFDVVDENPDAFNEWVEDQPRVIREAIRRNSAEIFDGKSAALAISLYKQHLAAGSANTDPPKKENPAPPPTQKEPLQSRRQQQLQGAQGLPSKKTVPQRSGIPAKDAPEEQVWAWLQREEEREAKRARELGY